MKSFRDDAMHSQRPELDELETKRRQAHSSQGRLSEVDARQQLAGQALAGSSGTLPYRDEMEDRFGRSFADVQVADGAGTRGALDAAGADAVARDRTVAFRDPVPAREVVAHELAHVVQSGGARGGATSEAEHEAHALEGQLAAGGPLQATAGVADPSIAHFRDADGDGSHDQPKSPWRAPDDEKEVRWQAQRSGPLPEPFPVPDLDPGARAPWPANAKWEQAPSHHKREDRSPFSDEESGEQPVLINDFTWGLRQQKWDAYRTAALQVQNQSAELAPDIDRFNQAEKDPDLKALGILPPRGEAWKGSLDQLTSMQELPNKGGASVSDIMNGPTRSDERGIKRAGNAFDDGKGGLERKFLATGAADEDVKAAASNVLAKAESVKGATSGVNSAAAAIAAAKAAGDADEAASEIATLKGEAAAVKSAIGFFVGLPEKLAGIGDKGLDTLSMVGTVATMMLDLFPDPRMEAAENRLAAARREMKTQQARVLSEAFEEAKSELREAVLDLTTSRHELRSALNRRRDAYNLAGQASGRASGGSSATQERVAAMVAAIPLVENVVARLTTIAEKSSGYMPAYSREAGIGYGIALHHQKWEAWDLPIALGRLEAVNMYYGMMLADTWRPLLVQLQSVKGAITGVQPESKTDNES